MCTRSHFFEVALMKSTLFVFFLTFIVSSIVSASEDFVCDNNGDKRIISIAYENDQEPVPCEVRYDKGEGVQTLWNAQSEVGFCERKADEFIQQQEAWGWNCDKFEQPVSEVPLEDLHTSIF